MTRSSDPIVLIGPMGAGKTSVGRRVAKRLTLAFTDTDAVIARAYGPIPDIFATRGEEEFRTIERHVVCEALATGGVVSLGGGAVLHPDTREELARLRSVALLTVRPEVVARRIRADGSRPLLGTDDALARWAEIYQARRALYEEVADATFDTSHGPLQDFVDAIVEWARRSQPQELT